jgi:D-3-phosphoglycerate dehydrogenase
MQATFVFDYDSTLVQVETLDELAEVALQEHPERSKRLQRIRELTQSGMEGGLSYEESLRRRLDQLDATRAHIHQLIPRLRQQITASVLQHRSFFREHAKQLYVISGGFLELIFPVTDLLGIPRAHVFANRFLYDFEGRVCGVDQSLVLCKDRGKVEQLRRLDLKGPVTVVGDGITDYEMRKEGLAARFVAFTENIHRPPVTALADDVAEDFASLLRCEGWSYQRKSRGSVLLLEGIHGAAEAYFNAQGMDVKSYDSALNESALSEALQGVHLLGIRSKTQISAAVLDRAKDLRAIGAFCIGTNQIDVPACSERGIAVFNAPFSNTRSVVELAMAEMVSLLRRVGSKSHACHQGRWEKTAKGCHEVRGKTLGIVGYGKIGSQLSILAEAFGMRVCYYDLVQRLPLGNAEACGSLDALLRRSDVVSVHIDGRTANQGLFSAAVLRKMRPGTVFLNLSRGHVVDVEALAELLRSNYLAGAAVDVFPEEPVGVGSVFNSPLRGLDNVIITPHIGGSTEEAQEQIGGFVAERLSSYWYTADSMSSVNLPSLSLPDLEASQRLVHIHANVPGVLAQIGTILAEAGVNVSGQHLQTDAQLGYAVMDIDGLLEPSVCKRLRAVPQSKAVRTIMNEGDAQRKE